MSYPGKLPEKYHKKKRVIREVLSQQKEIFDTGKSVPDRIVSISKSYVRSMIRGKETRSVEFGAKVNMIQVDCINFIDHLSFNPFIESIMFIGSIRHCRTLFGRITHISANDIYATNANRNLCAKQKVTKNPEEFLSNLPVFHQCYLFCKGPLVFLVLTTRRKIL